MATLAAGRQLRHRGQLTRRHPRRQPPPRPHHPDQLILRQPLQPTIPRRRRKPGQRRIRRQRIQRPTRTEPAQQPIRPHRFRRRLVGPHLGGHIRFGVTGRVAARIGRAPPQFVLGRRFAGAEGGEFGGQYRELPGLLITRATRPHQPTGPALGRIGGRGR